MKQALLLIDLQNDYFPDGKKPLIGIAKAAENAHQLLMYARNKKLPIYHVQHIATKPNATFFLPNTHGVLIHQLFSPLSSEIIIQKNYPNSFRKTALLEKLKAEGVNQLIIAGAMSHMCIDATTRAAFDYEFDCKVIEDACATCDLKFGDVTVSANYVHAGFMSALQGVYANVITSQQFYQENN